MSKLEKLIEALCPDGVEYRKIEDVCVKVSSGGTPHTSHSEYYGGDIPWLRTQEVDWNDILDTGVKITEKGLKNSSAKMIPADCVIVAMYGATAGKVAINKIPLSTNQACCNLQVDSEQALYKFVYYWLSHNYEVLKNMGQGSQSNINAKVVRSFLIPLPPLPVQREIVRILDNFTELTAELIAELTAEFIARKKQYEYYRNNLFIFNKEVQNLNLGDVCTLITKGTTPKNFTTKGVAFVKTEAFKNGIINKAKLSFVSNSEHEGILKRSILKEKDILFTIAGATIGKCAVVTADILPANTNQALAIIRLKENINQKYILYILQSKIMSDYIKKKSKGSAQPNLNLKQMNDFVIPFPSEMEQQRIVDILDRFDTLCNDMAEGLPAEIEARKQQYEYYRDKLLNFSQRS